MTTTNAKRVGERSRIDLYEACTEKMSKKRKLTCSCSFNVFLQFVIWYSRQNMMRKLIWYINSKMTVKSLLFICYGLTTILCISDESFDSSVGVNRIVAASNLGSNRGKKPFPQETKCEFLNRSWQLILWVFRPACYERTGRCFKRIIKAKFYIQDELYHMLKMSNRGNFQPFSIDKLIKERLGKDLNEEKTLKMTDRF